MPRFQKVLLSTLQIVVVGFALASSSRLSAQNHEPPPEWRSEGVQLLSPTNGVDFRPYVRDMLVGIKRKWLEKMPEEAMMGEKGRVAIVATVRQDGTLAALEPVIDTTSGERSLDMAALDAVRASAPFKHLPESFSGSDMKFRIWFLYNIPLAPQKPKP
jgi:TonB family protein